MNILTHTYFFFQHKFRFDVVNIQDPGQEYWRRKYVYWIPALHIDGKEVAKGRWDRETVIQALDSWGKNADKGDATMVEVDVS